MTSLTKAALTLACMLLGSAAARAAAPENFIYTGSGDLEAAEAVLQRADIGGAQIVYTWRSLEPTEGEYDFSAIERDLAVTERLVKNSYPFFNQYRGKLGFVGMAVQEPTLTYKNPGVASPSPRMNSWILLRITWAPALCSGALHRPG
jgi:hypothetical protein